MNVSNLTTSYILGRRVVAPCHLRSFVHLDRAILILRQKENRTLTEPILESSFWRVQASGSESLGHCSCWTLNPKAARPFVQSSLINATQGNPAAWHGGTSSSPLAHIAGSLHIYKRLRRSASAERSGARGVRNLRRTHRCFSIRCIVANCVKGQGYIWNTALCIANELVLLDLCQWVADRSRQ